jgi:hypothetical protein
MLRKQDVWNIINIIYLYCNNTAAATILAFHFHYVVPADATILASPSSMSSPSPPGSSTGATSLPFASPSSSLLFLRRCRCACAAATTRRRCSRPPVRSPPCSCGYDLHPFGCDSLGCYVSVCRGPTSSSQCQHSEPDRGNFFIW